MRSCAPRPRERPTAFPVAARAPFPQHVFEWKGASYFVDYPPGSVLVLWVEGTLYRAFAPEMPNRRLFNVAVNLGAFAGSLVVALLLYRSSPVHGPRRAALFWLNPAIVLCVPILGYQDTIFGAVALGALIALQAERPATASALIAAATLIKPQGALLLPILAVALLRGASARRWLACAGAGLAAAAVILVPVVDERASVLRDRRLPAAAAAADAGAAGPERVVAGRLRHEVGAGGAVAAGVDRDDRRLSRLGRDRSAPRRTAGPRRRHCDGDGVALARGATIGRPSPSPPRSRSTPTRCCRPACTRTTRSSPSSRPPSWWAISPGAARWSSRCRRSCSRTSS